MISCSLWAGITIETNGQYVVAVPLGRCGRDRRPQHRKSRNGNSTETRYRMKPAIRQGATHGCIGRAASVTRDHSMNGAKHLENRTPKPAVAATASTVSTVHRSGRYGTNGSAPGGAAPSGDGARPVSGGDAAGRSRTGRVMATVEPNGSPGVLGQARLMFHHLARRTVCPFLGSQRICTACSQNDDPSTTSLP